MSASSARRLRERPGGGAASKSAVSTFKPSKTLTPDPTSYKKYSSGKENPSLSTSRDSVLAQKPSIRPVVRVDKSAANYGGEARSRWSTSSAPRGRSPSPSQFIRAFSDRRISVDRSDRGPGSVGETERKGLSAGKHTIEAKASETGKMITGTGNFGLKKLESGRNPVHVFKEDGKFVANQEPKTEVYDERKVEVVESMKNVDGSGISDKKESSIFPSKTRMPFEAGDGTKGVSSGGAESVQLGHKEISQTFVNDANPLDKEKGTGEESSADPDGAKYPSKLHEKLAFLEGKVKRIASDIKRTKEMLDMNNPQASKVLLSDIQDKILGIEKAMSHAVGDSDDKIGTSRGIEQENRVVNMVEMGQFDSSHSKNSVKDLKGGRVLEDRLFPHHKLLRDRTNLNASSQRYQGVESRVGEAGCKMKEEEPMSPTEENKIAVEFLASLNKSSTMASAMDVQADPTLGEIQEMDTVAVVEPQEPSNMVIEKHGSELDLVSGEKLGDFDDQENKRVTRFVEELEDTCSYQLKEIGSRVSTGGWFVSEGESVLLAHDDGSCSFYDIVNCEEKNVYMPPAGISPNLWRDCWVIRAASADGCSGRYVVAASAGNAMDSGFCSWDFYTKEVRTFQSDGGTPPSRTVLGSLRSNILYRRNLLEPEAQQWWYKPCGPLMISTASTQRAVLVYDIRDGEQVMKWDAQNPVSTMDHSSPLQWRNKGKVVVAETDAISLWDVSSLSPQALVSVPLSGRRTSALHVNNTDGELGGGVRQRASSSEVEGNDGVFCTQDSINILDFRHRSGVGLRISKLGTNAHSIFSRGDSVFLGCGANSKSGIKRQHSSELQQFSLRKQRLFSAYALPECNADSHHATITQVWGNSNTVMCVSGLGLFVFDALKENELHDCDRTQKVREIVGPDDMYSPSFDYSGSRALLISRDRPAMWRQFV